MRYITIHAGHNPAGKIACGASDYIDESREARVVVKLVKKELAKTLKGYKVVDCTVNNGTSQNDVLSKIVNKMDKVNSCLNVSIHFNASVHSKKDGKTTGTEAYVYDCNKKSGVAYKFATLVTSSLSHIGFKNRGVKDGKGLYVIRRSKSPTALVEVCFVTDADDARLYNDKYKEIAKEIARCIKLSL